MGNYNFDQIVDRSNTQCMKFDLLDERFGSANLTPLWVADMDFLSPKEITDAIIERAKHGVFGYTYPSDGYYDAIIDWVKNYHNYSIKKEWISFIPGIVKGIAFAIDCFLGKDEQVIIQPPVYPPFKNIPSLHKRQVLNNPLLFNNGKYEMDLDGLEKLIKENPKARMLILCSPHNPAGIVWSRETLSRLADVCYDNNVLVVSDEIHADLAFEKQGFEHIPFPAVSEKAAKNSLTFMAPSKTFNIAGIVSSFVIVSDDKLRKTFNEYLEKSELTSSHIFAYVATEAAYKHGLEWLNEVKDYIWENIEFVRHYISEEIPQIKVVVPEASFLLWLDCRALGLSQEALVDLFVKDAQLALNNGITFGEEGKGFMRLNVGTSRSVLEKSLVALKKAINAKQ